MSITLSRLFRMTTFAPGAYQRAVQDVCAIAGVKQEDLRATAWMDHGDGLSETKMLDLHDLGVVRSLESCPRDVRFDVAPGSEDRVFILTYNQDGKICLSVSARDAVVCDCILNAFVSHLGLEETDFADTDQRRVAPIPASQPPQESSRATVQTQTSHTDTHTKELMYPQKITLSWLAKHAPISFWFWLLTILSLAFGLGMKAGQIPAIKQLFGS